MLLFVDQLTNVDFSYLCPERGLLGETWLAHIELEGKLDHQGMICDFGIVKKTCRQWLDEIIDHRLLVPSAHPDAKVTFSTSEERVEFLCKQGAIASTTPLGSTTAIPTERITQTTLAKWCENQLQGMFSETVQSIRISFTEESIAGPYYHYSHGLKKHLGNCQRIAHGHRSKILIWRNGQLDTPLMEEWAEKWKDIYIATRADLTNSNKDTHFFRYQAQQGEFTLALPISQCYFIDSDTTVELIAQHIADTLATQTGDTIKVKAYEGIGKGAIADSA